jgi:hypothetical protein
MFLIIFITFYIMLGIGTGIGCLQRLQANDLYKISENKTAETFVNFLISLVLGIFWPVFIIYLFVVKQ